MKFEELEALSEKATKGEWRFNGNEIVSDLQPRVGMPSRDEDFSFICALANHRHEIIALVKAAKSIANSTCCEGCQEAKRVAQRALAAFEEKK